MIKILGIGSPFGDDQIGWKISEELLKDNDLSLLIPQQLQIEIHDRPGVRLLDIMNGADIVFIIDAVVSGQKIGSLFRLQDDEIQSLQPMLSTHAIGVAEALKLGKALNQLPKSIIFYGVEIDKTNKDNNISDSIVSAIQQIRKNVKEEILSNFMQIK